MKIRQYADDGHTKDAVFMISAVGTMDKEREGYGTLYQFGRKDPFPSSDNLAYSLYFNWISCTPSVESLMGQGLAIRPVKEDCRHYAIRFSPPHENDCLQAISQVASEERYDYPRTDMPLVKGDVGLCFDNESE